MLGHRRIAYANARAGYFAHYSVVERYETLLQRSRELSVDLIGRHDTPFASALDFLNGSVLSGGATAIITYDHHIATELVGAAYTLKIHIPDDFSLICFNDLFPVASLGPPLTAVAVSGREMGRIGADLLLNALQRPSRVKSRVIRIAEDLIVRASTAPPKR